MVTYIQVFMFKRLNIYIYKYKTSEKNQLSENKHHLHVDFDYLIQNQKNPQNIYFFFVRVQDDRMDRKY